MVWDLEIGIFDYPSPFQKILHNRTSAVLLHTTQYLRHGLAAQADDQTAKT